MDDQQKNRYSHLTAIDRKYLSFPARYLLQNKLLKGKVLDFGCGLGNDVKKLQETGLNIIGYDPHYFPDYPQEKFDTIICFYVLNVLFPEPQEEVIMTIAHKLKPSGKAYFAVRRDLKKEGYRTHYVHKKPTYQRLVNLPFKSLYKDEFCEIYEYTPYNQIKERKEYCIFCNPYSKLELITESSFSYAIKDGYPLTKGHSLIIPKIHGSNYFDLPVEYQKNCWQMVNNVQQILKKEYNPDGFNVGFNVNKAGGQKVMHSHIHIIPRYEKDNQKSNKGIRSIISER
ncbi:HIT domain-containing protein [Cyanobacterium sp. IPPAS B-1200]|uniref:bifunctional class I SAM-dependent methyltransferase/HIT family protein n=1 Tax=Cyanobacterium sp. IPPAS B-1200 TaxID=1562720 RepID=UPI00085254A5|nr:bifunctional class I SAM-dependent methyltransferase/HIT family protein [Cyanobacterium sp. IPPAS B-1200]OEJ79084.1 HIT family protein [Cyanobacterium sp. IPPAS B-1200]